MYTPRHIRNMIHLRGDSAIYLNCIARGRTHLNIHKQKHCVRVHTCRRGWTQTWCLGAHMSPGMNKIIVRGSMYVVGPFPWRAYLLPAQRLSPSSPAPLFQSISLGTMLATRILLLLNLNTMFKDSRQPTIGQLHITESTKQSGN